MKHLSNTYDPSRPGAFEYVLCLEGQTRVQAWESHLHWLKGKVIAEPKATESYSVEELKEMGMVGVYAPDSSG